MFVVFGVIGIIREFYKMFFFKLEGVVVCLGCVLLFVVFFGLCGFVFRGLVG